eukprot:1435457-Prymnesium_polylepis.1
MPRRAGRPREVTSPQPSHGPSQRPLGCAGAADTAGYGGPPKAAARRRRVESVRRSFVVRSRRGDVQFSRRALLVGGSEVGAP